jgi:hypothetical protein
LASSDFPRSKALDMFEIAARFHVLIMLG